MSSPAKRSAIALVVGLFALGLGCLLPASLGRIALTLPAALFVPGYSLLIILNMRSDGVSLAALTGILSLAFWPLALLLAYLLRAPVGVPSMIGCVDALTVAALVVLQIRRSASPPEQRDRWRLAPLIIPIVGLAVAAASVLVTYHLVPHGSPSPYSAIYLTDSKQIRSPLRVAAGERIAVRLTVVNGTQDPRTFELVPSLSVDGRWPSVRVTVPPSQSRVVAVRGRVESPGCLQRLQIVLTSRGADTDGPPSIDLWLDTTSKNVTCSGISP